MNDCVFCKIINRELPAQILDETDDIIVFLSLENHPLVVPKTHIKDIYELDDDTGASIMVEAIKIAKATKKALNPDGMNLVQANEPAAQQNGFHFHLHVKPRWYNDNVNLDWEHEPVDQQLVEETKSKIKAVLID